MNAATLAICNAYERSVRRRQVACDYGSDPCRISEHHTGAMPPMGGAQLSFAYVQCVVA
jgi:hypothetical protein